MESIVTQFGIGGVAIIGLIKLYNDQKAFTERMMNESKLREDSLKQIITDQNSIITVKLEEVLERLEDK
jgi:hypothetical protein